MENTKPIITESEFNIIITVEKDGKKVEASLNKRKYMDYVCFSTIEMMQIPINPISEICKILCTELIKKS